MTGGDYLAAAISGFNTLIAALIWFKLGKLEGQVGILAQLEGRVARLEAQVMGRAK